MLPAFQMIHRAIGELKEPEGCTEESMSKFIRRYYDDLPWSHSNLLNHHLQKLCECGEMVVTSDNCYLLSDGITNLKSTPCYTPEREPIQGMQKRRGKKQSGRAGHCRNYQTEEKTQQEEQMVVICGQFKVRESQNLVIEDPNLAEEPHTETYEEPYALQACEEELQNVLIGDRDELEGKTMDSEHPEVNQREVLSP